RRSRSTWRKDLCHRVGRRSLDDTGAGSCRTRTGDERQGERGLIVLANWFPKLKSGILCSSLQARCMIEKIVEGVIPVAAVAQQELLAPLGNHTQGWLDHAVNLLQREGVAVQVQPLERLGGPILAHGLRNPLHQFLAVGLQQHGLAFCLLVDHHIHSNLFPGFCLAHLEDVQNQTIICANYSTTLCEGASIITTRQRTCLSACAGMMEECSTWTSQEVAHSLPGKDRPSTL